MTDEELERLEAVAMAAHDQGDFRKEADTWAVGLAARPENMWLKHNLARALMMCGELDQSLRLFQEVINQDPGVARAHNNLGVLLMRLGCDVADVMPAFEAALATSGDSGEFVRHAVNLCISASHASDSNTDKLLDAAAASIERAIDHRGAPSDRGELKKLFQGIVAGYRAMGRYREALADRRWDDAESARAEARKLFTEVGMRPLAESVSTQSDAVVLLSRGLFDLLGQISVVPPDQISAVIERAEDLHSHAKELRNGHAPLATTRLIDIVGWFLHGLVPLLAYLADPTTVQLTIGENESRIRQLAVRSYAEIGRDLTSILAAVGRQARAVQQLVGKSTVPALVRGGVAEAWTKIALFARGVALDFAGLDAAVAREALGWSYDAVEVAYGSLRTFREFIERQASQDLYVDGTPQENIARALLQAFMVERSYREVVVRGGRSDILSFKRDGSRFLYETKIWRGPKSFETGINELQEYAAGECNDGHLAGAFLVLFDPSRTHTSSEHVKAHQAELSRVPVETRVVTIRIHLRAPSQDPRGERPG